MTSRRSRPASDQRARCAREWRASFRDHRGNRSTPPAQPSPVPVRQAPPSLCLQPLGGLERGDDGTRARGRAGAGYTPPGMGFRTTRKWSESARWQPCVLRVGVRSWQGVPGYLFHHRSAGGGLGHLATRDIAAFLRNGDAGSGNPCAGEVDKAYAFGVSQSGRFLRQFLYMAVNQDQDGNTVFDGFILTSPGQSGVSSTSGSDSLPAKRPEAPTACSRSATPTRPTTKRD